MNCEKCKDKGYIEVIKATYPISFLPGIVYVEREKKPCAECNNVGNNTGGSSDTNPPTPERR